LVVFALSPSLFVPLKTKTIQNEFIINANYTLSRGGFRALNFLVNGPLMANQSLASESLAEKLA